MLAHHDYAMLQFSVVVVAAATAAAALLKLEASAPATCAESAGHVARTAPLAAWLTSTSVSNLDCQSARFEGNELLAAARGGIIDVAEVGLAESEPTDGRTCGYRNHSIRPHQSLQIPS